MNKWIKIFDEENMENFNEYKRKEHFVIVADVVTDNDLTKKNTKKRSTLIKFVPTIPIENFNRKTEWLYIFTINDKIVKIGGTRTGLKGRVASYLCGHHIEERGKSGFCSKTNGFIYNTFEHYLKLNHIIKMYGYELPKTELTIEIFGKKTKINAQTYHAYESTFLEDFKLKYKSYPYLNDNCDPDYKNK